MRRWSAPLPAVCLAVSVLSGITVVPFRASAQTAGPAAMVPRREPPPISGPVAGTLRGAGAGAVLGVVAFNLLAAPLGTVPFAGGTLEAVPTSVALGSRLIAVASSGAGVIGATWLYDQWTGARSDYRYLLTLGAGTLAGVAAGNYLGAGTFGTPPYYVGAAAADTAGVMASGAAQAASRVYVIGSGLLGAWVADHLYSR